MNLKITTAAIAVACLSTAAFAQEAGDITVGGGVSTFGLNLEGAYQIDPQLRARGALMGGLSADFEETEDGDTIEGEFNLGGLAVLADYYPMQNGWRVSGGLFFSNTDLDADGEIDGDAANVTAEFGNKLAPMITTGYDWGFGNGWSFTSEVGVIFTGGIELEFTADDPADQGDIDADPDVQDAIDDADDVTALPYISLGVSYTY